MKYLLLLWFVPLALFWGWYGLSLNDVNFGSIFLSRELHDAVFVMYGQILRVEPESIPGLLASASVIDSALIGAIVAFRKRKAWWPAVRDGALRIRSRYLPIAKTHSPNVREVASESDLSEPAFEPLTVSPYDPARPAG